MVLRDVTLFFSLNSILFGFLNYKKFFKENAFENRLQSFEREKNQISLTPGQISNV